MSEQFAKVSADLTELDRLLRQRPARRNAPHPVPPPMPIPQPYMPPAAGTRRPAPPGHRRRRHRRCAPSPPKAPRPPRDASWIGKVLAVAGVAVTLIGVVLLLVLAAQAGILRPEIRVGAGAVLAGALVGVAARMNSRPGGRVGAIALAATGVAAAYMDVIAITTIYDWVSAPVGLVLAAVIGGGGLTLARRWDSQHLGLLVLVPLIVLAPIVTDGITMLLIAFMLAISAASLLVQLGKDWIWLHAARIAAPTFPLLIALVAAHFGDGNGAWLAGGCAHRRRAGHRRRADAAAVDRNRVAMALLTSRACSRCCAHRWPLPPAVAALMAAGLAAALLAIVLVGDRLARRLEDRPADLVGDLGGVRPDRRDGRLRRRGRHAGAVGDGGGGRRRGTSRRRRARRGRGFRRHRRQCSTSATHRPPRWSGPHFCRRRTRSPSWCPASC